MSEYKDAADIAEQQLNNISSTMCYAKWAQVSMHLTNGMTQSCYHPPVHKVDLHELGQDPSALHNTSQKKSERKQMLKGERPEGCSYCWRIEDAGGRSDRIYRSGEYWAQNARKDIIASTHTGKMNPRYVEVNFNQACNFKCIYCSPHLSNTWEAEIKEHGPLEILDADGNITRHNDVKYLDAGGLMPLKVKQSENPYLEAFWLWWPELYKTLEVFRMTGGEPLMDSNTYKVLDYIYENPNAWLELSITSNFCPPNQELMKKFVDKIKKLEEIQIWESDRWNPGSGNNWYVNMATKHTALFISLDSVGEQAEYLRAGLDFKRMQKNVLYFANETLNTNITFINTFNILSVPKIKSFLKYILHLRTLFSAEAQGIKKIPIYDEWTEHPDHEIHPHQRIWFDIPLLRYPDWLCVNTLPSEYDHYIQDAIEFMEQNQDVSNFTGFYDFEITKLKRNLEWIQTEREAIDDQDFHRHNTNLKNYVKQLDERRNTNFTDTFPEFRELFKG